MQRLAWILAVIALFLGIAAYVGPALVPSEQGVMEDWQEWSEMEDLPPSPSQDRRLVIAILEDDVAKVRELLSEGVQLIVTDDDPFPPLGYARSGEMVEILVEAGAKLDARTHLSGDVLGVIISNHGDVALGETSYEKVLGLIQTCIRLGAPLEFVDRYGYSRLESAAFARSAYAVHALLDLGHPLLSGEDSDNTALHSVAWHFDSDDKDLNKRTEQIIRTLVEAGIDPNARDASGLTPLHLASSGDGPNPVAMKTLIELGADPNSQNNEGETPLSFLYNTTFNYEIGVPVLLEAGANPLIADNYGLTTLDYAEARARGENPRWRVERLKDDPENRNVGWKSPAKPGDPELKMLGLLRKAAEKHQAGERKGFSRAPLDFTFARRVRKGVRVN